MSEIIKERTLTHGPWKQTSWLSQNLKLLCKPYYRNLSTGQSEAVDMILHKIARILVGDPNHQDHWDDIAGYATLESQEIANVSGGSKVYEMVRHWQRTKDSKLLEEDIKVLLNDLVKTFKNKFEGRLHAFLKRRQDKYGFAFGYETERIPYTITGEYIPDFPIMRKNGTKLYIEAKGYFRPESKRKMVAVKKQHPELDIRIVFYASRKRDIRWAEKYGFPYAIGTIPEEWLEEEGQDE